MGSADFLTVDVYEHPERGRIRWKRAVRSAFASGIEGLRAATVNHANNGTRSLVPGVIPGGLALVAAWESPEAAAEGWAGPLRVAVENPHRYSLDGEIARVRLANEGDDWHGWLPSAEGTEPISANEPMVAVVHGILRSPRELAAFLRVNMHAASRAAHHPGHRGSVDISSKLPFEHTSISLWKTLLSAQDYAYKPGGHAYAMKHSLKNNLHKVGCFLQVRPLASSGALGVDIAAYPDLPPALRGAGVVA